MADLYVDAKNGNDSYDGLNPTWTSGTNGPVKTLQAAIDLITDPITSETIIYLMTNEDDLPFTGDCSAEGIHCIGNNVRLILAPYDHDADPPASHWNNTNYQNAAGSPFNPANGAGTWDPTADDYPVVMALRLNINNCIGLEIRGLSFEISEGDNCHAGLWAVYNSNVTMKYCRVYGATARLVATSGAIVNFENGHLLENDYAVYASYGGKIGLTGNNTIDDAKYAGITAVGGSLVAVMPWQAHPKTHYITQIRTTTPRSMKYTAVRASQGSLVTAQDQAVIPDNMNFGHLKIHNAHHGFSEDYHGVELDSGALLTGASSTTFTRQNLNGDTVDMPDEQKIVIKEFDPETRKSG